MNDCPRPLDPIDAEAVASGAEPVLASDAREHAAACAACGAAVERSRALDSALEALAGSVPPAPDLAPRVTRLRAFSRQERRTYALWNGPVLLVGAVGAAGLALLFTPFLSAGDQAGLGAAALAPVLAFFRSLARWAPELARVAPAGLEGLSEALSRERAVGLVALALLAPAAFGLSRVFTRARSGR